MHSLTLSDVIKMEILLTVIEIWRLSSAFIFRIYIYLIVALLHGSYSLVNSIVVCAFVIKIE